MRPKLLSYIKRKTKTKYFYLSIQFSVSKFFTIFFPIPVSRYIACIKTIPQHVFATCLVDDASVTLFGCITVWKLALAIKLKSARTCIFQNVIMRSLGQRIFLGAIVSSSRSWCYLIGKSQRIRCVLYVSFFVDNCVIRMAELSLLARFFLICFICVRVVLYVFCCQFLANFWVEYEALVFARSDNLTFLD